MPRAAPVHSPPPLGVRRDHAKFDGWWPLRGRSRTCAAPSPSSSPAGTTSAETGCSRATFACSTKGSPGGKRAATPRRTPASGCDGAQDPRPAAESRRACCSTIRQEAGGGASSPVDPESSASSRAQARRGEGPNFWPSGGRGWVDVGQRTSTTYPAARAGEFSAKDFRSGSHGARRRRPRRLSEVRSERARDRAVARAVQEVRLPGQHAGGRPPFYIDPGPRFYHQDDHRPALALDHRKGRHARRPSNRMIDLLEGTTAASNRRAARAS